MQGESCMDISKNESSLPHGAMRGNGRFLDAIRVFQVLLHKHPSGTNVPNGIKENVYFLLNNEINVVRQGKGKMCRYVDDCGAWSLNASCKSHHYVIRGEEQLDNVDLKDGQYCKEQKGCKVPMNPQPTPEELITFKRYYVSLKRNPSYRKRISTISKCPESLAHLKNFALVEYIGTSASVAEPTEDPLFLSPKDYSNDDMRIKSSGSLVDSKAEFTSPAEEPSLESNGKFLDASSVFQVMLTKQPIGQDIPAGIKENVYYLIDNWQNVTRLANGKRSRYSDDCGLWSVNGKSKYPYYMLRDDKDLDSIEVKDGQYYKVMKGERVVLVPQPTVENVVAFRQYYINLKADPKYRKRVSLVTKCPDAFGYMKNLAVVEYIGKFPLGPTEFRSGQQRFNQVSKADEEFLVCSPDIQSFNADGAAPIQEEIVLENGRFLDADSILHILLFRHPVGDAVPPGVKENVCFVIDNEHNITRKANGKRCRYSDDCGTWSVKTSQDTDHYVVHANGRLGYMSLVDGLYCNISKGKHVPIDPQPSDETVVVFSRFRAALKGAPEFRKRVSTVLKCPDCLSNIKNLAVIEYIRVSGLPTVSKEICLPSYNLNQEELKPISSENAIRNNGKFLDGNSIYNVLLHGNPISEEALTGIKENVYFLYKIPVDQDLLSDTLGKRCPYTDDCGPWIAKPSCKTHHYIAVDNEQLEYVDMKDGLYCKDTKGSRIALEPQPDEEEMITFKRYYGGLKRNPDYKRRISRVVKCADERAHLKGIAVVEYIGSFYG